MTENYQSLQRYLANRQDRTDRLSDTLTGIMLIGVTAILAGQEMSNQELGMKIKDLGYLVSLPSAVVNTLNHIAMGVRLYIS